MFKVKDVKNLPEMGFVRVDKDWVRRVMVDGSPKTVFTVYAGSSYIRHPRTGYVVEEQLKLIYDWSLAGYIEWED